MLRASLAICSAEFIGTFLLVFVIGCNVLSENGVWGVLSTVCVLVALVYIFAGTSGAHFNPAVTLSVAASGKLPPRQAAVYCCVQLLGGFVGSWACSMLFWKSVFFAPQTGYKGWQAGVAECIYTFVLCFVVLSSSCQRRRGHQFFGLAIGMVLAAGGYGAGAISGGCFNPAVAIGLDIASAGLGFGWSLFYMGFQLAGAALASLLFRVVRPREFFAGTRRESEAFGAMLPMVVGELFGTYIVILTFALARVAGSPGWGFAVGAAVLSMSFSLCDVCGVHFNPAVTLAVAASCRGKCSAAQAFRFIAVQILAAFLAAGTALLLLPATGEKNADQLFGSGHFGSASASLNEGLFTFLVCLTFLGTVVVEEPWKLTEFFGVASAASIIASSYALQKVSGGFLNPAAAMALSWVNPVGHTASTVWRGVVYSLMELIAGLLAAGCFALVSPDTQEQRPFGAGKV